ncbi:MAG: TPM domain-containing protein [Leptolyngbyaceae cyanobacterium CRU_2_3]|nr:TPM domain-containing protein [Leptolyngbyaceae cyanobacterium CRU_2_3]
MQVSRLFDRPIFGFSGLILSELVLSLVCILPCQAILVQDVPLPQDAVSDVIDLLNQDTESKINRLASQLETKNGAEVRVVTVPETHPAQSPRDFALELFNTWKIGKPNQDNGVLLLYSKKDDRVEIVTGWGLIDTFPDAAVVNLIRQTIRPKINQGDFNTAFFSWN